MGAPEITEREEPCRVTDARPALFLTLFQPLLFPHLQLFFLSPVDFLSRRFCLLEEFCFSVVICKREKKTPSGARQPYNIMYINKKHLKHFKLKL